ncbi:MAG: arabinan endo-1,5-alpha-L-arabinosidase [Phycisphaeraceae bacterium]|nr:MAG: arabinan endo-1,5-alpha-L-arabinosidase [Phycisphaeraceae bacterium]
MLVLLTAICVAWGSAGTAQASAPGDDASAAPATQKQDDPFAAAWSAAKLGRQGMRVHDPSRIVREGDRYYFFATGPGLRAYVSAPGDELDPSTFKQTGRVFTKPPAWITDVASDQKGYFWAPDMLRGGDGQWWLYYSVSSFGKQTSAIALVSSPMLDPEKAEWTDRGIVIRSRAGDPYNTIDPALFEDGGRLWMVFGSYWTGIKLVELDPATGMLAGPEAEPIALARHQLEPAWNNPIEAAALYKHGGWYYLFVNWWLCCKGVESTYEIRVGRSREITGPYVDRNGTAMTANGGTLVLCGTGRFVGPGHVGVLETEHGPLVSVHFYDAEDQEKPGRPRLAVLPMSFDAEDWPVLGAAVERDQ